mgnify:FL=1
MTDSAMNGKTCGDLVVNADSVTDAIAGDLSTFDPSEELFQSKWPTFQEEGKVDDDWVADATTPEGAEDLEGMDLGTAMCRQDYDNNGLDDIKVSKRHFCCQMVMNDATDEVVIAQLVIYGWLGGTKNGEAF